MSMIGASRGEELALTSYSVELGRGLWTPLPRLSLSPKPMGCCTPSQGNKTNLDAVLRTKSRTGNGWRVHIRASEYRRLTARSQTLGPLYLAPNPATAFWLCAPSSLCALNPCRKTRINDNLGLPNSQIS